MFKYLIVLLFCFQGAVSLVFTNSTLLVNATVYDVTYNNLYVAVYYNGVDILLRHSNDSESWIEYKIENDKIAIDSSNPPLALDVFYTDKWNLAIPYQDHLLLLKSNDIRSSKWNTSLVSYPSQLTTARFFSSHVKGEKGIMVLTSNDQIIVYCNFNAYKEYKICGVIQNSTDSIPSILPLNETVWAISFNLDEQDYLYYYETGLVLIENRPSVKGFTVLCSKEQDVLYLTADGVIRRFFQDTWTDYSKIEGSFLGLQIIENQVLVMRENLKFLTLSETIVYNINIADSNETIEYKVHSLENIFFISYILNNRVYILHGKEEELEPSQDDIVVLTETTIDSQVIFNMSVLINSKLIVNNRLEIYGNLFLTNETNLNMEKGSIKIHGKVYLDGTISFSGAARTIMEFEEREGYFTKEYALCSTLNYTDTSIIVIPALCEEDSNLLMIVLICLGIVAIVAVSSIFISKTIRNKIIPFSKRREEKRKEIKRSNPERGNYK